MTTTMKLFALVALLTTPTLAFSQPYASVQLGYAHADFPVGPPYNGVVEDSAPMIGIEAGYAFYKWSAELGFDTYGSLDGFGSPCFTTLCSPLTQEINGNDQTLWKLSLVRRIDIGDWRLFAKGGYYHANLKTNVPDGDSHPDGFILGIGARWYFSEPWSVALEAERFDDNVSQLSVGIGWGFGGGSRESRDYREGYRDAERDAERDSSP
jgi:outer membrane protein with beta-barrel domain